VRKWSEKELFGAQLPDWRRKLVGREVRWRTGKLHRIDRTGESVAYQGIEWDEWPRVRARFSYRLLGGRVHSTQVVRETRHDSPRGFEFHAGGVAYRLEQTEE
jgi:hypothetical protein